VNALILAAGRGTRLGAGGESPKCLTAVAGKPLLDRYLDALETLGVPVTIVVGFGASYIRTHVEQRDVPPTLIHNSRFTEGSIVSLMTGLESVSGDLLLLDGDVAFTPSMLEQLLQSAAPNALLVDIGTEFTDEQYMAGIHNNRVMALRRGPVPGHELQGEWVGFAKLNAASVRHFQTLVQQQITQGETDGGYEDALAELLQTVPFAVVPTNGAPWVEIDFAADLARANELFARKS
jgi:choline kinase